jgi:RimJ/RimL family protein N-acetyltransferase
MRENHLITLRPVNFEDLEMLTKWNFDPDISKYFSQRPENDYNQQVKWLQNLLQSETKRKFIIIDNETSIPIGIIGYMHIDSNNRNAEIGITVGNKNYWGKPHSKEALNACLQFGFEELNLHIIYSRVFENNLRAIRFFEKAGFTTDGIKRDCFFKENEFISSVELSLTADEFVIMHQDEEEE